PRMTLVLACAFPDIAFMVADTLLSSELRLKGEDGIVNGESHALKAHIFKSGHLAVGFSGDVGGAHSILQNLRAALEAYRALPVCTSLRGQWIRTVAAARARTCGFWVLQVRKGTRELHRVDLAGIAACQTAYIGGPDQY